MEHISVSEAMKIKKAACHKLQWPFNGSVITRAGTKHGRPCWELCTGKHQRVQFTAFDAEDIADLVRL